MALPQRSRTIDSLEVATESLGGSDVAGSLLYAMISVESSSGVGQSVDVPSKDPEETPPWEQSGWRQRYVEKERLDEYRGGFGIVVRVRDRESGLDCALKYPRSNDPDSRKRFRREIEHQVKLAAHPNVVDVLAHGDDYDWYTMPIAAGTLMKYGPELSDDEVAEMLLQIAGALGAGHRHGIIHRDVKPSNILLADRLPFEPRCWLIGDFGIARAPRGQTTALRTATPIGTDGFIAPEVLVSPHEQSTPAADVFGLGRTLAWLTTGQTPEALRPSPGGGVWAQLAERMTELRADDRMPSMDAVTRGVRDVLRGLRADRRASWGRMPPSTLGWREDRIIWTIMNEAPEPATEHELPRMGLRMIEPGDMSPGEVRAGINRLLSLGYLVPQRVSDRNGSQLVYELTAEALRYASENVDRLVAAFRGDGGDRVPVLDPSAPGADDDMPF